MKMSRGGSNLDGGSSVLLALSSAAAAGAIGGMMNNGHHQSQSHHHHTQILQSSSADDLDNCLKQQQQHQAPWKMDPSEQVHELTSMDGYHSSHHNASPRSVNHIVSPPQTQLSQTQQQQGGGVANNGNTSNDVISLHYMELEEFLLENAVAVAQEQHQPQQQQQQQQPVKVYMDPPTSLGSTSTTTTPLLPVGAAATTPSSASPSPTHLPAELIGSGAVIPADVKTFQVQLEHRQQQEQQQQQQLYVQQLGSPSGDSHSSDTSRVRHLSLPTPGASSATNNGLDSSCNSSTADSGNNLLMMDPHSPSNSSSSLSPSPHHLGATSIEAAIKERKGVKRSRKESVPTENKDDKYWKRRAKNNEAAKRSRDLRREKESQIMQRVQILERENSILHAELQSATEENKDLKERLARYEQV